MILGKSEKIPERFVVNQAKEAQTYSKADKMCTDIIATDANQPRENRHDDTLSEQKKSCFSSGTQQVRRSSLVTYQTHTDTIRYVNEKQPCRALRPLHTQHTLSLRLPPTGEDSLMIHNSHRNPDNDQNLCPTFPKNFAETFHTMGIILHAMKRPQIINISSDVIEYAQQKLLTHTSTPTHCLTGHGRCKLVLADLPLYVNLHRSLSYAWLLLYWLIGQEHFHGSALPCGSKAGSLPRQ